MASVNGNCVLRLELPSVYTGLIISRHCKGAQIQKTLLVV
jgi:hypothetical protein